MATKRGLFIVLEGPDGAGISTQTALLQSGLASHGVRTIATKEPTSGPIGSLIRQALTHRFVYPPAEPVGDDVLALLYAADRLDHIRARILPRLEAGVHVVCDRYRLSSYAYQGLTMGQEWVRALNNRSIAPDLTIFINVPLEVSQSRIAQRGEFVELYETEARLRPIYNNYLTLVEEFQKEGERIVTIDGALPIGVVSAAVLDTVLELINEHQGAGDEKPRYTFHYTPADYFNSLDPNEDYTPPAYDEEGFIHCTDGAENMVQVVNRFYRDNARDFLALYIDKTLVKSAIKYEDSQEIYPHIYGPLNRDAIAQVRPALREPDGAFLPMPEMDE